MPILGLHVEPHARPRAHLVVSLRDDAGLVGRGEAAPLPGFTRDDVTACARALASLGGALDFATDRSTEEAVGLTTSALGHAPTARFAVECALLDVLGKQRGVTVARLLAGDKITLAAELPVNALLLAAPLETLAARAVACADAGYGSLKIKLRATDDRGFEGELRALREVRERLPEPFEIRLDPNGTWSLEVAKRRLDALAEVVPAYVEQPVATHDLPLLGACAVPVAADESLAFPEIVDALLSSRVAAIFVVKPAALGLFHARQLARRAQAREIGVVVTHLRDGAIAMAAARELAFSLPRPLLACGLASHPELGAFGEEQHLDTRPFERPGALRASMLPGLGLQSGLS